MNDQSFWNRTWFGVVLIIFGGFTVIGIVAGGVGLLIAAFRIALDNPTPLVWVVIQVLIAVLTIIVAILCVLFAIWTISYLRDEHKESVEKSIERTPTAVAAVVLFANGTQIVASNYFRGGVVSTTAVSLVLLLFFWIANELAIRGRKWAGAGVWWSIPFVCVFFALWNEQWKVESLLDEVSGLDVPTQVLAVVGGFVILLMPFFFPKREPPA